MFEIRNILVVNERRKRITESDTGVFLRDLAGLRIRINREPEEGAVLRLARTHRLSVYNASYLELALRAAIPLANLGRRTCSRLSQGRDRTSRQNLYSLAILPGSPRLTDPVPPASSIPRHRSGGVLAGARR